MEFMKWFALIMIVFTIAEVLKYAIKHKASSRQPKTDPEVAHLKERLASLESLEERVKTLEKIVTDPSETLKREINGLS
ncbi:hypothetical protein [Pleionea sp. CnH1-48]|uniref:hypothetical protein n=1 Tax=Pleionea sp. CnH1-48 TaxID=2954494 RepID=UPI0020969CBF|nr:hypothetical protein [Pleionea sp. CnH1-48]MCO7225665.1 hypothetical protein [Pleionea sp. CnH1-48]